MNFDFLDTNDTYLSQSIYNVSIGYNAYIIYFNRGIANVVASWFVADFDCVISRFHDIL